MPAILRSVIAQVHRKSRSIGSLHKFSSTPRINVILEPEPEGFGFWLVSRSLGFSLGCIGGHYLTKSKTELAKIQREESIKRQKEREKMISESLALLNSLKSK